MRPNPTPASRRLLDPEACIKTDKIVADCGGRSWTDCNQVLARPQIRGRCNREIGDREIGDKKSVTGTSFPNSQAVTLNQVHLEIGERGACHRISVLRIEISLTIWLEPVDSLGILRVRGLERLDGRPRR
jgi:hypothetical protein